MPERSERQKSERHVRAGKAILRKNGLTVCPTCGGPLKTDHFENIGQMGGRAMGGAAGQATGGTFIMIASLPSSLSSGASKRFEAADVSCIDTVNAVVELNDDELREISTLGLSLTSAWVTHRHLMLEAVKPAIRVCADLAAHIEAVGAGSGNR